MCLLLLVCQVLFLLLEQQLLHNSHKQGLLLEQLVQQDKLELQQLVPQQLLEE